MTALDPTQASPAPLPSLKTLLITDLVDSTRLVETLGDQRAAEVFKQHDRLARDLLDRYAGREIDRTDGFLLLFERPIDAALYALAFHDALSDLSAQLDVSLSARAGVHLGEVVLIENSPQDVARGAKPLEVEGLAKPIAARIMSLASGGQTLLSKAAFDLARRGAVGSHSLPDDLRWLEHGPYLFKGVSEPMTICEVGLEGEAPLQPPPNSEKVKRAIAPGDEETLGWRPAPGLAVPGREGWGLQKEIGKGGFGEVWLARHNKTKEVRAFKFCFKANRLRSLKRELTLFRLMKEVLGDRRDIARLYEVQLEQAPFFLEMEYTAGGDLAAWAKRQGGIQKVPLDTRLEIVAQIGEALSAAHSVGVIHKDVKPTNVLIEGRADVPSASVPADRSAGPPSPATIHIQAKLTDFGIGQLLDKESLEQAGVTVTGFTETAPLTDLASRTGTRLYMAPELLAGKPASIQSDIYALGVLLYQVVVGDLNRPLAQGWENEVKDELLREDIAACVAGEPAARLSGADLLAHSLRSLTERGRQREAERKRVAAEARRRRLLRLTGASAVVLGLLAVVAGLGYWNADQQRRRAEAAEHEQRRLAAAESAARGEAEKARDEAQRDRKKAEKINEFVTKALVSADPNQAGTQGFLVTDAMEQAIELLDAGTLKDQPGTDAALRLTIAEILNGNARSGEALKLAERALEINRELYPGDHLDVSGSLYLVAHCLQSLGRSAEALPKYEMAREMYQRLFEGDHAHVAASLGMLADCLRSLGRSAEALSKDKASLEMCQRLFEGDHPHVAASLNNVALDLDSLGLWAEALPKYEAALQMYRRIWVADHPHVAASLNNVAGCLLDLGRSAEALREFEAALEMDQRLFEGDHPDVARSLSNMAACLNTLGRSAEALPKFEAALEMQQRLFEGDHANVASTLNNVAVCLQSLGRLAEALPKYEAALMMKRRLFPGDHPDVARSLNNLGACLRFLGRSAEALPKYEEALAMFQRLFVGDHPDVAIAMGNVAAALKFLGRSDEALPVYEAALMMKRRVLPPGHPSTLYPQVALAATLVTLSRFADAEPLLRDAAEQCQSSEAAGRMHWRNVITVTVKLYDAWHDAELGQDYDAQAAEWRAKMQPTDLVPYLISRGSKLVDQGKQADAEPLLRECLKIRKEVLAEDHWLIFNTMSILGAALAGQEKFGEAEPLLIEGYEQMKPPPASLSRKQQALKRIVTLYDAWHAAEPDEGYDTKAAEWRAKLPSKTITQPASQPASVPKP